MVELAPVARPYAQAAFELARDSGQLAAWSSVLDTAAAAVVTPEFARLLQVPGLDLAQLAGTLADVCSEASAEARPLTGTSSAPGRGLLLLLAENRRLQCLPEIAAQFAVLRARAENAVEVEVHSATELDEQERRRLTEALERRLGKQVRLSLSVDQKLLGGAWIRVGDQVIDGSVRARLEKLANAMTAG
ncbi:MAG: F0F1 ATP synthase subunit delta [Chromatiales bacterium]|nr:F0F1 ATP synthase subunit delta [Chromatiales bacterium]